MTALGLSLLGREPMRSPQTLPEKSVRPREKGARLREVEGVVVLSEEEMDQRLRQLQERSLLQERQKWDGNLSFFSAVFYGPSKRGVSALSTSSCSSRRKRCNCTCQTFFPKKNNPPVCL
uniref:Uncharacterized protein n=1 Tax=Chromera velia CCMP2878 TaxID=1169474 RepID=A0A0G4G4V0_9ALVE|eukprot:Cvel_20270.t1-p1 / transcript=Cvel_20270.t1 / gene=Cvel_20270 / organism=Chromera_velia_CCMP2878 / gene_product=hypothetical protein / transcript_product=hypothetical protein / location=Cvel_scaffold1808:35456-36634(-) / protein_length=119 / sequence_SO=supercontig / SO=protein_coding / is_pseudo=false